MTDNFTVDATRLFLTVLNEDSSMVYKIVLILAIIAQVLAAGLSLRLNVKYRWNSAWFLISASAILIALQQIAVVVLLSQEGVDIEDLKLLNVVPMWTAVLAALMMSVFFLGGVALIQPLFLQMARAQSLLKQEKLALENVVRETEDELRLARAIQQNLLPKESPNVPGFDIAGASIPAVWTSGDYFDFLSFQDGSMAVAIADVSGHGTGPALLMSATRAFLRALAVSHCDVGKILTIANKTISEDVSEGRFVTLFLARVDPLARQLNYASAGHDGFLIDTAGEVKTMRSDAPPLGAVPGVAFDAMPPVEMKPGDIVLLVSDGIPETESPQGEQFGDNRTVEVVYSNRHKPSAEIVDCLLERVRQFAGNAPQQDDITAVVIKVLAVPDEYVTSPAAEGVVGVTYAAHGQN
jgi:sigma-B regulation protein RsbU (phosphoserine phosphatase)